MTVIRHWDGEDGASASYVGGRLRIVAEPTMTAGNGRVTVEIDAPWIEQLAGAVNEAKRLECALEQVRARFHESDMRGVRETLDAALNHTGGQ